MNEGFTHAPADGAGPHKRHTLLIAAGVFLLLILVPVGWFLWQTASYYRGIKTGALPSPTERRLQASVSSLVANAQVTPEDLARLIPASGRFPELGARNAKVTIVEFVDYQCPFCQRSAPAVRQVMATLGDRVRLIIRDFPIRELHPGASQSALAARCVLEQNVDMYWRYHDLLFADIEHQSASDLRAKAGLAGAQLTAFDACVAQNRYGASIEADIQAGLRAGVQGTPTFFVNGIKVEGAQDAAGLTRVIQTVMEQLPK